MKCDVHTGKIPARDDCLKCWLPLDATKVRAHGGEGLYLYDSDGKTYACRQNAEGYWYETAPPRGTGSRGSSV